MAKWTGSERGLYHDKILAYSALFSRIASIFECGIGAGDCAPCCRNAQLRHGPKGHMATSDAFVVFPRQPPQQSELNPQHYYQPSSTDLTNSSHTQAENPGFSRCCHPRVDCTGTGKDCMEIALLTVLTTISHDSGDAFLLQRTCENKSH